MQTPLKNSVRLGSPLLAGALCPCLLLASGAGVVAAPRSGSASAKVSKPSGAAVEAAPQVPDEAEFEVVAAGDELYRLLAMVQRGGLLQNAPRGGATRYEMALETGRAALALASRRASRARVSEDSARALGDLLLKLRPELRRLDVDVDAALALCRTSGSSATASVSALLASTPGTNGLGTRGVGAPSLRPLRLTDTPQSLSSRLRWEAAEDSWKRSLNDPFGGEEGRSPSLFGAGRSNRSGAAFFDRPRVGPRGAAQNFAAGASLDIFNRVRVRTAFDTSAASSQPSSLQVLGAASPSSPSTALLPSSGAGPRRSISVGADIELPANVTLSGDVQRLGISGQGFGGTSIGGQARLSAFKNRLSLSMNVSRLVPEERARLSQSTAGATLAVGNSDLQFKLLYQQLFGPSSGQSNRVIAGGVNITF